MSEYYRNRIYRLNEQIAFLEREPGYRMTRGMATSKDRVDAQGWLTAEDLIKIARRKIFELQGYAALY